MAGKPKRTLALFSDIEAVSVEIPNWAEAVPEIHKLVLRRHPWAIPEIENVLLVSQLYFWNQKPA